MPGKRGADDDDYVPPSGAARGAKKHPVSEAVLRFATEKKGAKAGPFVNKIFESSLEGAEQKVQQLEEADAASAEGAQPLSIIADCLMMIVAWLFYFIKIEWLDEREESGEGPRGTTNRYWENGLRKKKIETDFWDSLSEAEIQGVVKLRHLPSVCLRAASGATACTTRFRPQLVAGSCT